MKKKNKKFYPLTTDVFFKKLFINKHIFAKYMSLITGIEINEDEITLEYNEILHDVECKSSRFDIRTSIGRNEFDLEGQVIKEKTDSKDKLSAHARRKIHYAAQIHSDIYNKGEEYIDEIYPKTYIVFIVEYDIPGDECIQHTKFVNTTTKQEYDDINIIDVCLKKTDKCANINLRELLEVLKVDSFDYPEPKTDDAKEVYTMVRDWNDDDRERNRILQQENGERWFKTELELMRRDAKEKGIAEGRAEGLAEGRAEGLVEGRAEGLVEGRAEGLVEAKKEMVINMNAQGISIDLIAKITGFTESEILNIISK